MKILRNDHERAFELKFIAWGDYVSDADRQWLENHLASCPECRERVAQTEQMIAALKTVSINAGADVVGRTRREVRTLALQREARQRRMRPVWISSGFASIWMACSTPYLWQSFDWTGHWLHIPDLLWQMGFLVAWFTPALTGAAVALWLRPHLTRATPNALAPAA